MEDDFHEPWTAQDPGPPASIWQSILTLNIILALFLGPVLIVFLTRYLSERSLGNDDGKKGRRVWMPPYWIPFVGHGIDFIYNPIKLMSEARDQSMHGIFGLYLGGTTLNISQWCGLLSKMYRYSPVFSKSRASTDCSKFFGLPKSSKAKYDKCWDELNSLFGYFMKDPQLGVVLKQNNRLLEQTIPQMISFVDSEVDLQPWERIAKARYISSNETEINLCGMMRDLMGHTSVSAMFGSALMDKYPDLLHNTYRFDEGMYYLLAGLPRWTPWPPAFMAHMARNDLWAALDDQQRALDALAEGKPVDYSWGELDDVSEFIMKRNEVYRKNNFEVKERGELSVLWPLIINSSLLVYWQLLYILADPDLTDKIRAEVSPYTTVEQGESIGKISEAPKLTLDHEGLSKHCPHLRSTYLEALRLTSKPWSVRKVASDVTISQDKTNDAAASYMLHKGEYITLPHELHMTDPKYFQDPDKFAPGRFLVTKEDGTLSTDAGTIRPYGGGPSMCKGRIFAERECLAAVAGILVFWDIVPADKKAGWVIPQQLKMSAVSKPAQDTRVRIKRRVFGWEKDTKL
ncbi:25-hydroxycholesterol 7-alpha-hydroxylase [Lachnellula arida]|uniref:25-hydroxycholesterol 7-alpha-hydroxylase n=1 Tax=Lachnellula arida TaxID=1316785 RepID=A0A8T9B3S7_9HELO|nr:25-hydroxycholesterol 7-alpha-hydroxylase [Lachnellula arida]